MQEGRREGWREGGKDGGREGGKNGGREGGKDEYKIVIIRHTVRGLQYIRNSEWLRTNFLKCVPIDYKLHQPL